MKFKIRKFVISTGLLTSLTAFAEIREATTMRDVAGTISPGTLVVFDLDNTVLEAAQTLGTDQFFSYLVKKAEASGLHGQDAKDLALKQSTPIQPRTKVRLVEEITRDFVLQLQDGGLTTFALTARPASWAEGTLHQVKSLGLDFAKSAPNIELDESDASRQGNFHNGVLFLQKGVEKGPTLLQFLENANLRPDKVVFIDDKISNVTSVDESLTEAGIPIIAFRYGAADKRVKNFNPEIAEFEYKYFLYCHAFISDELASQIIQTAGPGDAFPPYCK